MPLSIRGNVIHQRGKRISQHAVGRACTRARVHVCPGGSHATSLASCSTDLQPRQVCHVEPNRKHLSQDQTSITCCFFHQVLNVIFPPNGLKIFWKLWLKNESLAIWLHHLAQVPSFLKKGRAGNVLFLEAGWQQSPTGLAAFDSVWCWVQKGNTDTDVLTWKLHLTFKSYIWCIF